MSSPPRSLDETTTLCLACSASILPSVFRRHNERPSIGHDQIVKVEEVLFFTNCCKRPICPSCVAANARLRHYDPCLHCLAGIGVVSGASVSVDQNIFVLGDDEDEEPNEDTQEIIDLPSDEESTECTTNTRKNAQKDEDPEIQPKSAQEESDVDARFYLSPTDTLQSIALRFGVNGYELCRLNNLPPSTLTTNPHLLHTRPIPFIQLPPSVSAKERERDKKKLQLVEME